MRKPVSVVVSSSAGKAEQLHELIQATLDNTVENMKLGFEFDGEFQITALPMSAELIVHQRMVKYEEEEEKKEEYAYSKQAVEDMYIELIGMADLSQGKGLNAKQVKEVMYRNLGKSE